MARDESTGRAVTFQALNKDEAKGMLVSEGLDNYKIVWESTPKTQYKELVKNKQGEHELKTKRNEA